MVAPAQYGSGRAFSASRMVRLGDVTPSGRLRLDALARYLQDVASDDAADAGMPGDAAWVLRRTVLDVGPLPHLRDEVTLTTWCSGTGARWAERSTAVVGVGGVVHVSTAALWVYVDLATGRPRPLGERFDEIYAPAAAGRTVRARLEHPEVAPHAEQRSWPLRRVDADVLGHVNNAAYWAPIEELVGECSGATRRIVGAELEYRSGIDTTEPLDLAIVDGDDELWCWMSVRGEIRASSVVRFGPGSNPVGSA